MKISRNLKSMSSHAAGSRSRSSLFAAAFGLLSCTLFSTPILAQTFPSQPVRLVVPFPPGGGGDVIARQLSKGLTETLGAVVVDYKPGANTIVGAEFVARSAPDGHTLLLATNSTLGVNPAAYKKLPYDANKDFAHVARILSSYHLFMARLNFPANTVAELVALAKSKPGSVTYGSTGYASSGHFAGLLIESRAGVKLLHVPYKGASQVITDLLGDQVDLYPVGPLPVSGLIKSGKLKALAAASDRRFPSMPDVPTMSEAGYPGFTSGVWYVISARAGTPSAIVDRLNREIYKVFHEPAAKAAFEADAFTVEPAAPPAAAARFVSDEIVKWTAIIKEANIKLD